MSKNKAIVIGAGIVGLATARALSLKGFEVTIIEKSEKAVGASIRNFGMIWPIGQPTGELYNRAMRSKNIWKELADQSGLWYHESGSLHTAYFKDEWQVLQELYEIFKKEGRPVELLDKAAVIRRFESVNPMNLMGGLYSSTEMIVDPRVAINSVSNYLSTHLNVQFIFGKAVTKIETHSVWVDNKLYEADLIFVCSGADFETLYPAVFESFNITKCKLQMMRFVSKTPDFKLGVSLCGGLSLIHYSSFKAAASINHLKERYETEMPAYIKHGIHVMVAQNNYGELTVGDSHEYGLTHDPFDSAAINQLIVDYLQQFTKSCSGELIQTWNGIYPKMTNGANHILHKVTDGVYILNGLGGAGMTLSFGLAEEIIGDILA
ncbi:MAG: TIGR03364 family FAD-dependent oxidoreductase [Sphingobacteriia bacterium]|nr:MAG: TIGR03364 family FAD-dependent oxidoreductase [Sphingobacteriia bacterium]